jgi:4-amino-4-deoxy-L-arabinose transferase-like glycosyltransferase
VEYGREFAARGLACTLQIGYPGVTTMWAGSLGLLAHYWQTVRPEGTDLATFLQSLPIHKLDTTVIAPMRLPLAIVGALFVPLFYILLRRLFTERVAVIAALLLALHPFHIALTRVLHHDALTATFMVLSLLALTGYWLQGWRWPWLPFSAVMTGFALLSKQVSWFMMPFVVILAAWTVLYRWQQGRLSWLSFGQLIGQGLMWGLMAGLTFTTFFPAMWVIPVEVLRVIFSASTDLAGEGHTHYFLGEISKDPGPFFYLVGWLLRATPWEVLGGLGFVAAVIGLVWQRPLKKLILEYPIEGILGIFVALLWVFVSISDKKLVRYYLPAFPILSVLASLGLLWLWDRLMERVRPLVKAAKPEELRQQGVLWLAGAVLLTQGWLTLSHYPYYFTYHNPLFGGTPGAARLMTIVGWGEGLHKAANYLNRQPQAESLQIVTERVCSMLRPFAVSDVFCLNSSVGGILRADYVVYYYNLIQRDFLWVEQWQYFRAHRAPVHRVTLHGLDYVLIYRNPIQHQVDRQANSLAGLLTVFGYNLAPTGQLTLFWQNQGLDDGQLLVGLAPTRGVYPVETSGPGSAQRRWIDCRPNPAFAGELHTSNAIIESFCPLDSAGLPAGLYDLQVAVDDGFNLIPIQSSRLAVFQLDSAGQFKSIELVTAAQLLQ